MMKILAGPAKETQTIRRKQGGLIENLVDLLETILGHIGVPAMLEHHADPGGGAEWHPNPDPGRGEIPMDGGRQIVEGAA
jgi:hypothetical protein